MTTALLIVLWIAGIALVLAFFRGASILSGRDGD